MINTTLCNLKVARSCINSASASKHRTLNKVTTGSLKSGINDDDNEDYCCYNIVEKHLGIKHIKLDLAMPHVKHRGPKYKRKVNRGIEPRSDQFLVFTLCRNELYYHDLQIS